MRCLLLLLLACSRPHPTVVTNLAPPQRTALCRVEVRETVRWMDRIVRVRAPCLAKGPPVEPASTGDVAIDSIRRDEHARHLRAWAALAWAACSKP